ncbi:MAG: nicotinate-nucleotide--dimethylbenzimidazole phosphoribosyltransferase [Bryobacterales bacterium]|nr:nicotinate-nucleotide--dimethylbenzimidazole phosphoribosyltransferase [Bryobacterales bacterium]
MTEPDLTAAVRARWDALTKPQGSLGLLEETATRYAVIRGTAMPSLARKAMYVFCADHGVTAEGVSAYPAEVTPQMVRNFLRGGAAISVLCRHFGIEPIIVDAGVNAPGEKGVVDCKIDFGTRNFARVPAMTREQAELALERGRELAALAARRFDIAGLGEMGIGNTTPASALLCVFAGVTPTAATGRGTGLSRQAVARKAAVIRRALALHTPDPADAVGALAAVGGFEIAMMAGFLMGAAAHRLPVMIDGFISCAAMLAARVLEPRVEEIAFYSHRSAERAHGRMLKALGARPLLELDLRLGEGTGAALGIALLETAVRLYSDMATFAEARVAEALS